MSTLLLGGRKVGYEVFGDGPLVVLSHSLGANRTIFSDVVDDLKRDHAILVFDMRGHGESDLGNDFPGLNVLAEDLSNLLAALEIGAAHLVGQSIGAMALLEFASNHKEFSATYALFDAVVRASLDWDARYLQRAALVDAKGLGVIASESARNSLCAETRTKNQDLVQRYEMMITSTSATGYSWACRAMLGFDLRARLAGVSAPVMVAAGDQDTITTMSHAREIVDSIPAALLVEIPGSGHVPCLEQPVRMASLIRSWIASHPL